MLAVAAIFGIGYLATRNPGSARKYSKPKSLLFLGDSNTFYRYSYAHTLKQMFPSIKTKIIAKVGVRTSWMLKQFQQELLVSKPDVVFVLGGSNDIYALDQNESAKSNLAKIYSLAKRNGIKVVAISPPNKNWFTKRTERKQRLLLDLVEWISRSKDKDYYVNFWKITDGREFFDKSDGYLHAQKPAHDILAKRIISLLRLK